MHHTRLLTPYELTQLNRYAPNLDRELIPAEIPIEYVTGKVEFCGAVFSVTKESLIPRVETEELVSLATKELQTLLDTRRERPLAVTDIGTGCGAVILSLIHNLKPSQLTAVSFLATDVSATALEVAKKNAAELAPPACDLTFLVSDLCESFPSDFCADLLIANLPYIPTGRLPYLDKSVTAYEPEVALDGGEDGLKLIRKAITQLESFTRLGSVIWLEVDYTHTEDEFISFSREWSVRSVLDSFTRNRFIRLERR